LIVDRYTDKDAAVWDAFVRASRNGTFLFERAYMDYHRDRFEDHSLLIRDSEGEVVAVLPAHSTPNGIASHNGLTFGGLVVGSGAKLPLLFRACEALLVYLQSAGFAVLDYKTVPHIYHRHPCEEDRYALFLLGAEVTRRDLLSVVTLADRLPYQTRRARGIKKAQAAGVTIQEETNFAGYWELLSATLAERHEAVPVHSLAEIEHLHHLFPTNIRLHTARLSGELMAGVVTYDSPCVRKAQYIAASPAGREVGALDLLFDRLLTGAGNRAFFDFGTSHTADGINTGLIDQKEGFGARAVVHDHYRIDLTRVRPGVLAEALR
jgi:hypothetical protein